MGMVSWMCSLSSERPRLPPESPQEDPARVYEGGAPHSLVKPNLQGPGVILRGESRAGPPIPSIPRAGLKWAGVAWDARVFSRPGGILASAEAGPWLL